MSRNKTKKVIKQEKSIKHLIIATIFGNHSYHSTLKVKVLTADSLNATKIILKQYKLCHQLCLDPSTSYELMVNYFIKCPLILLHPDIHSKETHLRQIAFILKVIIVHTMKINIDDERNWSLLQV